MRRAQRHAQVEFYFAPTYSFWINQLEIWFVLITRDGIRSAIFRPVLDMISTIQSYVRSLYPQYPALSLDVP